LRSVFDGELEAANQKQANLRCFSLKLSGKHARGNLVVTRLGKASHMKEAVVQGEAEAEGEVEVEEVEAVVMLVAEMVVANMTRVTLNVSNATRMTIMPIAVRGRRRMEMKLIMFVLRQREH
jgi:hypothetical protein